MRSEAGKGEQAGQRTRNPGQWLPKAEESYVREVE